MNSSNPTLNDRTFSQFGYVDAAETMTVQGTVNKTGLLLLCVMISAAWTWHQCFQFGVPNPAAALPWAIGGAIGGFIVALILAFKMEWAPYLAPAYALLEGLFLGGVSSVAEARFGGIVLQAVGLTFCTFAVLLVGYTSGAIQATDKFKAGIVAATGGIFLVYLATMILGIFGVKIPYIHGSGLIGIGFSLFVVIIAALNLVLDFDFIDNGARMGAPRYMEWYGAFALTVTLVWLYIEILNLLMKLRNRD